MLAIDHLDAKPLQRPMPDVPPANQPQIRPIVGIQSHRVVQIEKPAAAMHEIHHGLLLVGRHPYIIRPVGGLRSHQSVAQNHEQWHSG